MAPWTLTGTRSAKGKAPELGGAKAMQALNTILRGVKYQGDLSGRVIPVKDVCQCPPSGASVNC